jgi:hypothetical protein
MAKTSMEKGDYGIICRVDGDWVRRRRLGGSDEQNEVMEGSRDLLVLGRRHISNLEGYVCGVL